MVAIINKNSKGSQNMITIIKRKVALKYVQLNY